MEYIGFFSSLSEAYSHFKKIQDFDDSFYRRKHVLFPLVEFTKGNLWEVLLIWRYLLFICRVPHNCLWTGLHHCQTLDERHAGKTLSIGSILCDRTLFIKGKTKNKMEPLLFYKELRWVFCSRYPSWAMMKESWIPAPSSRSLMGGRKALREMLESFFRAWRRVSTARWSCTRHRYDTKRLLGCHCEGQSCVLPLFWWCRTGNVMRCRT